MQNRKGKIDLENAQVVTTDELGGLLFTGDGDQRKAQLSSKISIENSRRFVIRVSEEDAPSSKRSATASSGGGGTRKYNHHYLCAEIADGSSQVNAQASRNYMQQWLHALQAAARAATAPSAIAPMDSRELSSKIAAYMDHMHLAACVSGRDVENKKSIFEMTVKAWILQRELVANDEDGREENSDSSSDSSRKKKQSRQKRSSWQILEYSCVWKVRKTTAQFRDFDAHLRQFFQRELRDLVLPSSSTGMMGHLLQSTAHAEAENQRRVTALDAYVQHMLRLSAFSAFGSDASVMLDNFLDISSHFASFRQIEKATGQNLQLRKRKIVSWREREQFETLYKMHLEANQPQDGHTLTQVSSSSASSGRHARKPDDRRRSQNHHHHHRDSTKSRQCDLDKEASIPGEERVASPAPVSVRQASIAEVSPSSVVHLSSPLASNNSTFVGVSVNQDSPHAETVQERIAKIGRKLIVEAFTSPPTLIDSSSSSTAIASGSSLASLNP